jgi:hypothetical protein
VKKPRSFLWAAVALVLACASALAITFSFFGALHALAFVQGAQPSTTPIEAACLLLYVVGLPALWRVKLAR